jgi:two-component system, chemotaxis family, protein-glutamate methylesterase/glutaminase
MADVKVMVVDDSAAMRALFCDILDNAKGVTVCGVAKNADEAREKIPQLRPDVITLDVEMPGMSGMEFLSEIMANDPLPVIMLSSITQAGTGTAQRALELGAVHCFPKPLHSSGAEYEATIAKLGDIVRRAASGELVSGGGDSGGEGVGARSDYISDDSIVVLACGQAGLEAAKRVLAAYPAACPPTILVVDGEADAVAGAVAAMRGSLACEIEEAVDGLAVRPGRALIAYDGAHHIIVEPGDPPRLRLVERDPVAGFRPSADLLLGSLARTELPVVAGVLAGTGTDGAKGLQMLGAAGRKIFIQRPADYAPRERYEAVRALGVAAADLDAREVASWVLEHTAKVNA